MFNIADIVNTILQGDSLTVLKTLPSESIDCCITSPPYWGLRAYLTQPQVWDGDENCQHIWAEHKSKPKGGHTKPGNMPNVGANRTEQDGEISIRFGHTTNFCIKCNAWRGELGLEPTPELYVKHITDIFREVKRVLKPEGTLWLNLGDSYGATSNRNGLNSPLSSKRAEAKNNTFDIKTDLKPKDLVGIPWRVAFALQSDGWYLRQDIIWHKPNPMPESVTDRCTKSHEYIFLLAKSQKYYFDNEAIKEKAKYAGDDRGSRNDNRRGTECNSMSGITGETRNKRSVWTITTKPYSGAHFATFPEDLVKPMILAGCPAGGLVLDPFMGAGTTGLVAKKLGRNYLGIELNPKYIEMANRRINAIEKPLF